MRARWLTLILAVAFPAAVLAGEAETSVAENPTWSGEVAAIVYDRCTGCHRPGQGTPMSFQSYGEVRPWARAIAKVVESRVMPPWHATEHVGAFANDRSLEDWQIETLVRWAGNRAPLGDAAAAPRPPEFPESEWRLGEPDLVVTLPEVEIPAGGPDVFHNLTGKVMLDEDRWVSAVEILPGNTKVNHHVIAFQVHGFDVDPEQGWLGAWAAGAEPFVFPPGTGRVMRKGANIIGDMHYHPTDTAEKDQTRIGLHFLDASEVEKELVNVWVMNTAFEIPAGDPNFEVRARHRFLQSGRIWGLAPHMHYRGKDWEFIARYPDGSELSLLRVDRYDFNWQTMYTFTEPLAVPEGTVLEAIAHFDNSPGNPVNPDPGVAVTFGDESYDEMMIGFLDFVVDDGVHPEAASETRKRYLDRLIAEHPGEVFVYPSRDGGLAGLHLPRSGEGTIFLQVNRDLEPCRIYDIRWDGESFQAKVDIPNFRSVDLEGTAAESSFVARLHVQEDRSVELSGGPAGRWQPPASGESGGE